MEKGRGGKGVKKGIEKQLVFANQEEESRVKKVKKNTFPKTKSIYTHSPHVCCVCEHARK